MVKRVKNRFGIISEVPKDYPEELMRQLGLEEVKDEEKSAESAEEDEKKRRR